MLKSDSLEWLIIKLSAVYNPKPHSDYERGYSDALDLAIQVIEEELDIIKHKELEND